MPGLTEQFPGSAQVYRVLWGTVYGIVSANVIHAIAKREDMERCQNILLLHKKTQNIKNLIITAS
jgi:hypothetical protein